MAACRNARIKDLWALSAPKDPDPSGRLVSRMSALISCYNAHGQQIEIPNVALGEAFTGFQEMSRTVLTLGKESLDPSALDVTLMQVGPSSVDFHFDVKDVRPGVSLGRGAARSNEASYAALDRLVTLCCAVGQALLTVAAHPGCALRTVGTHYGPHVEILVGGAPQMILDPIMLELMQLDSVQSFMRALLVPLGNPEFAYVTVRREIQGVQGMANHVMISNEHVRDFVAGGALKPVYLHPTPAVPGFSEENWQ